MDQFEFSMIMILILATCIGMIINALHTEPESVIFCETHEMKYVNTENGIYCVDENDQLHEIIYYDNKYHFIKKGD